MSTIVHERCFNHALREAVARCPECRQSFCRECVIEHDDRVLCASCLKKVAAVAFSTRRAFTGVIHLTQCVVGLLITWFFFFLIGEMLLRLPSTFHEGGLWRAPRTRQE
jgi:hypothetical protein